MSTLTPSRADNTWTATLSGELDIARRPECDRIVSAFAAAPCPHARLDMTDLDYMDTTGLTLLIRLEHLAARRGGHVTVSGANSTVRRLFELTGLDRFLDAA